MSKLFRRHSNLQCFFCRSPCSFPLNVRDFKCPECGCRNRYDNKGEIISDEPAMHDEALNHLSFAKRGSPRRDILPTSYGSGPFCHSCQTNQMLIINLLSNYLPSAESHEYQARLDMLPKYRESLHLRYPPVCDACLPLVEEEIQKKDKMARIKALGTSLNKSKERQRRISTTDLEREKHLHDRLFWWRVRGLLWGLSYLLSILFNLLIFRGINIFSKLQFFHPILPILNIISLLWIAWDRTYASHQRSQLQGRDLRIHGKQGYIALQMTVWTARMISASIFAINWFRDGQDESYVYLKHLPHNSTYLLSVVTIEITALISSFFILRLQQPPSIRLVDTHSHLDNKSRSTTPNAHGSRMHSPTPHLPKSPTLPEHDALATLSLSSQPVVITHINPIFGVSSMKPTSATPPTTSELGEDEMDWTPTNPTGRTRQPNSDRENSPLLRPQRFFAPEQPTGLERLFESNARIQDENVTLYQRRIGAHSGVWQWFSKRALFCGALVALLSVPLLYFSKRLGLKIQP